MYKQRSRTSALNMQTVVKSELDLPVDDAWVPVASKRKSRWNGGSRLALAPAFRGVQKKEGVRCRTVIMQWLEANVGHNVSEVFAITLCILRALLTVRRIAEAIVWHDTFYL